jgi:Tol biopolymer transport system component
VNQIRKTARTRSFLIRSAIAALVLGATILGLDEGTFGVSRPSLGVLAFVRGGDVWATSGSGYQVKRLVDDASAPAWSPDGKKLAFARGGEMWLFDLTANIARQLTSTGKRASDPAWLDSATVAYSLELEYELAPTDATAMLLRAASADARRKISVLSLWAVDTYSGRSRELLGPATGGQIGNFSSPAVNPQTRKLAFAIDGDVWIADSTQEPIKARRAAASAELAIDEEGTHLVAGARRISWTPDGVWAVFDVVDFDPGETGELRAVNSLTGETIQITHRAELGLPPARSPSVSPAGGLIAYEEGNDIWLCGLDGSDCRRFLVDASQPTWSPRAAALPLRPDGLLLPLGR